MELKDFSLQYEKDITEDVFNKIVAFIENNGYKGKIHCRKQLTYKNFQSDKHLNVSTTKYIYGKMDEDWTNIWCIDNNPQTLPLISLKQILPMMENTYKYTPKYCKNKRNKVVIHVLSIDEVKECDRILDNNQSHKYLYSGLVYTDENQCILAYDSGHSEIRYFKNNGYDIIKASDFIKYNKKKETMENKKLIGYKLTDKITAKQASEIFGCADTIYENGCFLNVSQAQGLIGDQARRMGVYDIWFEAVYEEEFKVGDYLYDINDQYINIRYKVVPISRIDGDRIYCKDFIGESWISRSSLYKTYRRATPQEIKDAYTIKINGYEVKRNLNNYKIGCKTVSIQFLLDLNKMMRDNGFKETSFDGIKVDLATITRMIEME